MIWHDLAALYDEKRVRGSFAREKDASKVNSKRRHENYYGKNGRK
jgi:hypothetical protein